MVSCPDILEHFTGKKIISNILQIYYQDSIREHIERNNTVYGLD
jgi:glucose-6-phosphate 1-dehydrogenase